MKNLILIVSFLLYSIVDAQITIHSLDEATSFCFKNNHDLSITQYNEDLSKVNFNLSLSALSPKVNVNSGFDYNYRLQTQLIPAEIFGGVPGTYQEVRFGTPYNWTIYLDATMPVVNTSLWQNINTTNRLKNVSKLQTENAQWIVREQLTQIYYAVLLNKNQMEILNQMILIQDSLLQNGELKYKMGFIEQTELNKLKSLKLNAKIQFENSNNNFHLMTDQLKLIMGIEMDTELVILDSIPIITPQQFLNKNTNPTMYPSFKSYVLQEKVSRMNLNKEYFKFIPEFSLNMRYGQQAFRNELNFFDPSQNWFDVGFVGLKMDWPVFAGLSRWSMIRKEKINLKIIQSEKEYHLQERLKEDREIMNKLKSSFNIYQSSKEVYELAEDNYRLGTIKYSQGFISIDQVSLLYSEFLQSYQQYLNALYNFKIMENKLSIRQEYSNIKN